MGKFWRAPKVTDPNVEGIDLLVAPDRQKHGQFCPRTGAVLHDAPQAGTEPVGDGGESAATVGKSATETMRGKLRAAAGHAVYKMRKAVVEPVLGQIKERRGLRGFSFRGREKVAAEWQIICLTHNLLKLFRGGVCPEPA